MEENIGIEDSDTTLTNITPELPSETQTDAAETSNSEQIWVSINRRIEELEQRTQRLLEEERRVRNAQAKEREGQWQARIASVEENVNRSMEATGNVTYSLEERELQMQAQINRLEQAQTRVAERLSSENYAPRENINQYTKPTIKYILPEFHREGSPMKYIRQMRQYWAMVQPRRCDEEYLIEKSLSGPPSDWWLVVKDSITNFDHFLDKFQERYWGEQTQHELRKRLEFGSYRPHIDKSRSEYATKLIAEAMDLIPAVNTQDMIRKLARHYSEEIKYAIVGRGVDSCEKLIQLLEEFDLIGYTNQSEGRDWRHRSLQPRETTNQQYGTWRSQNNRPANPMNEAQVQGSRGASAQWTQPAQRPTVNSGARQWHAPEGQRGPKEGGTWKAKENSRYRVQQMDIMTEPEITGRRNIDDQEIELTENSLEPRQ